MSTPRCPTATRLYERGKVVEEDFAPDRITELMRAHPDAVLWLDMFDPDLDDLAVLQADFGLHPLAVEDAVHDHQRPKLDHYPDHLFINVYAVRVDTAGREPTLHKVEISAFVTERALITVHKSEGADLDALRARWDADGETLGADAGVGFLVYGLLDVVVDGQLAAARALDEAMDKSEDAMLSEGGAPRTVRAYSFALRRLLWNMRRGVAPMSGLVADLMRADRTLGGAALAPYMRNVDDHARRAADTIESARERINELLDADLSEQSNALNDITRKLAAWAAVIAVPTAITGFFGQNLPFPGYERWGGFLGSTILLAVSAGGLYVYLKSRRWL